MSLLSYRLLLIILLIIYVTNQNFNGYSDSQLQELNRLIEAQFTNSSQNFNFSQPLPNETTLYNEVRNLNDLNIRSGPVTLTTQISRPGQYDSRNFGLSPESIVTRLHFYPSTQNDILARLIEYTENLYVVLDEFCQRLIDIFRTHSTYLYVCYYIGSRTVPYIGRGDFQNLFSGKKSYTNKKYSFFFLHSIEK